MQKRGQAAAYIIIALILLFSFGLLVYIRGTLLRNDRDLGTRVTDVPVAFKPVQHYVEQQIEQALLNAVKNLGQHAGYVDPYVFSTPSNLENPTESIALKPFESSSRFYPYWYFMESPNSCKGPCSFKTLMPPLKSAFAEGDKRAADDMSIEAQIDRHIANRLASIDFSPLGLQGIEVRRLGEPRVTTTVKQREVVAEVFFPLEAEKDRNIARFGQFRGSVRVELPRIYVLAGRLTQEEKDKRFLENLVVQLLSTYSGLDPGRLPPIGMRIVTASGPIYWSYETVKPQLAREVLSKISGISVAGTANAQQGNEITGAVVDLGARDYRDLHVFFLFPDSRPFYLAVNDQQSGMLGPSTLSRQLPFFKLVFTQYFFNYDISFPVLVTIRHPGGLNGEDYTFQFALEGNVRSNQPLFEGGVAVGSDSARTMFCDESQRLSGEVTIRVLTSQNAPVEGADVHYHCAGQGCYIGSTSGEGLLKAKLPLCVGGSLEPIKEGYVGDAVPYDASIGLKGSVQLRLDKTKRFVLEARKLVFSPIQNPLGGYSWPHEFSGFRSFGFTPEEKPLDQDEELIVSFKRVGGQGGTAYQYSSIIKGGAYGEAMLASGEYEVSMMLIKHKELVVPEQKCGPLSLGCVPTNETRLSEFQAGGGSMNSSSGYLRIGQEELGLSRLTLYPIYLDIYSIPQSELKPVHLSVVSRLGDYSIYFRKYKAVFS